MYRQEYTIAYEEGKGRGCVKTNKTRLISELARTTGVSHRETKRLIDSLFEAISVSLSEGSRVVVSGFGSFEVRASQARQNTVPGHADRILVPARTYPAFRASRKLRRRVARPLIEIPALDPDT